MDHDEIERRRAWDRDGFFVVRRQVGPERVRELAEACDHVLEQVRQVSRAQGHLTGHRTTHVSGLLAPEYFAQRPETLARLSDFISSREVLTLIRGLGRPGEGLPNLRDTQYFHELRDPDEPHAPSARDYDGAWHRDGDGPDSHDGATLRPTLLRFRMAFAPDDHLEYVPGSHARPDTLEERRLLKGTARNGPLPSAAVRIALERGDVCVFHTWGIHRARYQRDRMRRTLDLLFGFGPRQRVEYSPLATLAALAVRR